MSWLNYIFIGFGGFIFYITKDMIGEYIKKKKELRNR